MIGTIIIFLLIFFVIVMGHEFGHFLIAKVNGIRVNEFAIGMGPKIAGFKKGETEYALRAFPLGGACIFEGEDGLEAAKEEASAAGTPADKTGRGALRNVPVDVDRGNFQNAPVWSRIATVFAGPLFNFLLAFIFAIMVAGYAGADLPVLGSVVEGSAAEAAGMQAGDKILRFNSKINLAREISLEMALNKTGEPVKVVYERDGQEYETTLTPIYNEEAGKYLVGFQNYASYDEAKGTKLFRYAWYQLRFCIKNSVLSVKSLVEGKLSKNDVAGPVGMAQIVDQVKTAAEPGGPMLVFMNMVNLAMLLSVSLGVMNLLPLPALDAVIAQAAVTYLKLCGFVLYFRLLAAGCGALLPQPWAALPAMLLEVCSGCDQAARTGLWASTLCCAALSVQGVSVLLQVRTICPAEISLRPLLAARAVHLPLSVALFWLGSTVPVQAVQTFTTLTERVVVLRRVPLDCALLAFAVCCITVEELARS